MCMYEVMPIKVAQTTTNHLNCRLTNNKICLCQSQFFFPASASPDYRRLREFGSKRTHLIGYIIHLYCHLRCFALVSPAFADQPFWLDVVVILFPVSPSPSRTVCLSLSVTVLVSYSRQSCNCSCSTKQNEHITLHKNKKDDLFLNTFLA